MRPDAAIAVLETARFVPVVRASSAAKALKAARALVAGGCRVVEVTYTTPNVLEVVRSLVADGIPVGVGTVLNAEQAVSALDAGASFLVSPHFSAEVLAVAHGLQRLYIPGALTPTEALTAHQAGAPIIKIFPVESMGGARYLKLLRDPMPFLTFFPTGGVNLDNAQDLLAQGAVCVGVGSDLASGAAVEAEDEPTLTERARLWVQKLKI